ncbi:MAG: UDP-N-acetylglucosamine--N-acetylmuramyl-(pentapeptide) pyrophosphoryl-undecaprenol N-acetylglucosamine transferase [Ktedonobacterales bacterium]|jgi:UDP-N-acetylglucosamine--N-acetylmuramyl-(pentapeptide) pyrophosphoryl-undecaprenol N-acetylglucosamine transferase|nr:MAG: UDP-N-acetylglucosamine--N-acetylmuramyl-(pentapeptide) pyrophosphoryl-undecaprenol N-acetylglucosamine transferase [Ktedonobacterales bacterium]
MRILISGGGTGGHIYPALAVARELSDRYDAELLYLGDVNGLETDLVPRAGIPFAAVEAGKFRRYLSRRTFSDLARVPKGIRQAMEIVRQFRPHAAFTSGGYVAVPAGFAARRFGAPLLMHQQDVSPNLSNRLLTPFASRISVSFPDSLRYFPRRKTALTGNPVREDILHATRWPQADCKRAFGLNPHDPVLLVTGGSQGARHLNQVTARLLPQLLPRCQVLHISGDRTYNETRAAAEPAFTERPEWRGRYVLRAYLTDRMAGALAASDIVLCRSGASTLTELATLGLPSVLVPLPPGFTGSPQAVNAAMFRQAGAAELIADKELTVDRLASVLLPLLENDARRTLMANAAAALAHPEAAAVLADTVAELAKRRGAD